MSNPIPTTPPPRDPDRTIEFFWDPVCPFAWLASRWIEEVRSEIGLTVDWRFISLRLINKDKDYPTHFPPGYEFGHTAGLRMLRVAARIRHELGRDALDPVVTAYGESYFDKPRGSGMRDRLSTPDHLVEVLTTDDKRVVEGVAGRRRQGVGEHAPLLPGLAHAMRRSRLVGVADRVQRRRQERRSRPRRGPDRSLPVVLRRQRPQQLVELVLVQYLDVRRHALRLVRRAESGVLPHRLLAV